LGWGPAHDDLVSALLTSLATAERVDERTVAIDIPEQEATAAREAVERIWRKAAREDALAELRSVEDGQAMQRDGQDRDLAPITSGGGDSGGATTADFSVAVSDSHDPPELPSDPSEPMPAWDDLPAEWKSRFELRRDLGRREYAQALKRERREEQERANAPRRSRPDLLFRHPGLSRSGDGGL
jgi:hypothetical protein